MERLQVRTHRNYVELGGEDNPWEADINPLLPNNPTVICIAPQFQKKSPSGIQWSSQMLLVGRALEERARSPSLYNSTVHCNCVARSEFQAPPVPGLPSVSDGVSLSPQDPSVVTARPSRPMKKTKIAQLGFRETGSRQGTLEKLR